MLVSITRWSLAHKRLVVLLWVTVTIIGIASSGAATKALSDQYSVPGREGYDTNVAILQTFRGGGDQAPLIPVVTLPTDVSIGSPAVARGLRDMTVALERALPGMRIASYASTHDLAFVSADGRTTYAIAYPPSRPTGGFGSTPKAVHAAEAALRHIRVAGAPVHLTGLDALSAAGNRRGGLGLLLESMLGGGLALLVLAFVFASLMAIVPLLIAVISIMTSFVLVWALTSITAVSSIVEFLIALVGLGVAIDYSLLIIVRWREERALGHDGDDAIIRAMRTAGRAVVFSGTTVAVGLLSLIVLPVPFLRSVGYGGMLIPLVSVAVAVTLLPVILATVGPRLDWPHIRSDRTAARGWTRWAQLIVHHRLSATAVAVTILALLSVAAGTITLGAPTGAPNTLSQRSDARTGLDTLERTRIGSGVLSPIEILAPRTSAARIVRAVARMTGVQGAIAPTSLGWNAHGQAVVDILPHTDSTTTLSRVADRVHALHSGARVGGIAAQNNDFISAVYGSFPLMVALIALLTFLLLARAFRSVVLPLKAIILNMLSVSAAWGALVLVWQHGYGSQALWGIPASGSIPSWLPVIVFAFLFGLSMDYEVFILARIREEYDRSGGTDNAVIAGLARTGRLVTSAALILFLGFVAMATAPNTLVKMIATGLGAGILLDATVIRALLVPAAVSLLGRINWWLPRPLARLLRATPPLISPERA